jgi:hypothetical protein
MPQTSRARPDAEGVGAVELDRFTEKARLRMAKQREEQHFGSGQLWGGNQRAERENKHLSRVTGAAPLSSSNQSPIII